MSSDKTITLIINDTLIRKQTITTTSLTESNNTERVTLQIVCGDSDEVVILPTERFLSH